LGAIRCGSLDGTRADHRADHRDSPRGALGPTSQFDRWAARTPYVRNKHSKATDIFATALGSGPVPSSITPAEAPETQEMLRNRQKKPNKSFPGFAAIDEADPLSQLRPKFGSTRRDIWWIDQLLLEGGVHSSQSHASRTLLNSYQDAGAA
jgi:hypothetical protein